MKTIKTIILDKIIDSLDQCTLSDIAKTTTKILVATLFAFGAIDISFTLETLEKLAKWNDFVILRTMSVFVAVYSFNKWWNIARSLLEWFVISLWVTDENPDSPSIRWVAISDIADYIMENWNLPRNEICEYFWITRSNAEYIINWLDSVWIFKRWMNNARILDQRFTRSDIENILIRASQNWEFRPLFRKVENWYTHSPTGFTTCPLYE